MSTHSASGHIEQKILAADCCCWRRAGRRRSQVSVWACSDVLWHVFLRVAVACSCSPLCVCLGNSRWPDDDLVQRNREALLAPTQMAQSQCVWTVSKHAVCTSTESSITERSPHFSLVLLQPVCMPDFKKIKKQQALRVLNIKGNIAGSLSSSATVFISSRQHRYMSARENPSLPPPSHLLSANGKPKPTLSPGESQPVAHTLWSTHTRYRAASLWCQFNSEDSLYFCPSALVSGRIISVTIKTK